MGEPPLPDLSRIYETYHARVVAYAARLLGPGDAEDVAQEVFIKVGRALDTLADASKLGAWIYAITRNAIRDAARKRCSRPEGAPATPFSSDGSEDEPAIARVPGCTSSCGATASATATSAAS